MTTSSHHPRCGWVHLSVSCSCANIMLAEDDLRRAIGEAIGDYQNSLTSARFKDIALSCHLLATTIGVNR